jgi:hypothetical protein
MIGEPHCPTRCCFCDDGAVAIYYFSHGCTARPDLTVQPLCAQHECKATPVGEMELLKDLRMGPEG